MHVHAKVNYRVHMQKIYKEPILQPQNTYVNQHRCNLSAHARVLSLIEGKWRILKALRSFGFQEDQQCFCYSDC